MFFPEKKNTKTFLISPPFHPSLSLSLSLPVPSTKPSSLVLLDERVERLPDSVHDEPDLPQPRVVEHVAPVEHERGLDHRRVDLLKVQPLELVPLGHDAQRVRAPAGLEGRADDLDVTRARRRGAGVGARGPGPAARVVPRERLEVQVLVDLRLGDLGVEHGQQRPVRQQALADVDRGGLARVSRVLLEREAEDGDALPGDGVEHRLDHAADEPLFLVVVDGDDRVPVLCDLRQPH